MHNKKTPQARKMTIFSGKRANGAIIIIAVLVVCLIGIIVGVIGMAAGGENSKTGEPATQTAPTKPKEEPAQQPQKPKKLAENNEKTAKEKPGNATKENSEKPVESAGRAGRASHDAAAKAATLGAANPANAQDPDYRQGEKATVHRVIDGDTLHAGNHKIRMIGLDTPESKHPRKPVECFGHEAARRMTELVAGKTVYLVSDPSQGTRDKYTRSLFYVYLEDGTNVAHTMIYEGYGHEYTYYSQPHRWQTQFRAAQHDARENKRGLWADSACGGGL
ncbi:MAG: thermonuclease family protein [Microbacteriaceae bacterium]|nr:thermonuclease family protein [Microbacteriaceae bacterium]